MARVVGGVCGIPEVGGDPDALDDAAADCRAIAAGFARIREMMRVAGQPDGWSGVAAVSFSGRIATESGMLETGIDAFADGGQAFTELADELRELRAAIERLAEQAERAEADQHRQSLAADYADQEASSARARSMLAGSRADSARLTADPSLASHLDEQAREQAAANLHATEAADRRRTAATYADDLRDAQATARRKVDHYEQVSQDASRVFDAMAAVAPRVNTVWGVPVAPTGNPDLPGQVKPVLPRTTAPPKDDKEESGGLREWLHLGLKGLSNIPPVATGKLLFDPDSRKWVHHTLDGAGFLPGAGLVPDLANGALYAAEGDWDNAAWSLGAAVPIIGDAAKGGRIARGAARSATDLSQGEKQLEALRLAKATRPTKASQYSSARESLKHHINHIRPHERYLPDHGVPVLGKLEHTFEYTNREGFAVLKLESYSIGKNVQWLDSIAERGVDINLYLL